MNDKRTSLSKEYGNSFEEKIIQAILSEERFAEQIVEILQPDLFDLIHTQELSRLLKQYYFQYNSFPTVELVEALINKELGTDKVKKSACLNFLGQIQRKPLNGDLEFVKENSIKYFKTQNLRNVLLNEVVPRIENQNFHDIEKIITKALSMGEDRDFGYDYLLDENERFEESEENKVPTPWKILNELFHGGWEAGRLITFIGGPGCHQKGTKILMYDGSVKNVEDVIVGDKIMGEDGSARTVLSLCRGRDKMYKIIPVKGFPFIVNEGHILSLKTNNKKYKQKVVNLTVRDYLEKNKTFKHCYKLQRKEVDFPEKSLIIEPYMLGVMLGDGSLENKRIEITTLDFEIVCGIYDFARKHKVGVSVHHKQNTDAKGYYFTNNYKPNNPILLEIENLGLKNMVCENKFIPKDYLINSRENRLELLAGLLDTDGSYDNGFDFVNKSKQLVEDVIFLARSLGFSAYLRECKKKSQNGTEGTYYRTFISGDCSIIPTRVKRKQAKRRKQIKDVLVTGFSVEELEEDDYYGFSLDGNNLYLTEDFIVHHNSGKSHTLVNIGIGALLQGYNVVHYTLELEKKDVARRYDAGIVGVNINDVPYKKQEILHSLSRKIPENTKLIIKPFPMKSASIQTIKSHLARLRLNNIIPDIVIIDYGDLLKVASDKAELRHNLREVWEDMKGFAQEYRLPVITATQTNRTGNSADVILAEHVSEDFSKIMTSDIIITMARNIEQKAAGLGKTHLLKSRQSEDGQIWYYTLDTAKCKIELLEESEELEDKIKEGTRKVKQSILDDVFETLNKDKKKEEEK